MRIETCDFNGASDLVAAGYQQQWANISAVLQGMPLHLKASDQDGIQGNPIFDPVGTNQYISDQLVALGWSTKIVIPNDFSFLGTDIDFGKQGTLVEIQFSNYPFLLNNVLRSELFFRANTVFHEVATGLVIIVTKAGIFPSSNSTLYYEQAVNQLTALAQHHVFTAPIRLVGLFENVGTVTATWTEYSAARYSRTVISRSQRSFVISSGRGARGKIVAAPPAPPAPQP